MRKIGTVLLVFIFLLVVSGCSLSKKERDEKALSEIKGGRFVKSEFFGGYGVHYICKDNVAFYAVTYQDLFSFDVLRVSAFDSNEINCVKK
jgi:hypothetical protein